jgi:hypothetical protein
VTVSDDMAILSAGGLGIRLSSCQAPCAIPHARLVDSEKSRTTRPASTTWETELLTLATSSSTVGLAYRRCMGKCMPLSEVCRSEKYLPSGYCCGAIT